MLLGGHDRQFTVDQSVLQDGRTYRTQEVQERLQEVCVDLGDPAIVEKVFDEKHAASIVAKEKNIWKPTPASLLIPKSGLLIALNLREAIVAFEKQS